MVLVTGCHERVRANIKNNFNSYHIQTNPHLSRDGLKGR